MIVIVSDLLFAVFAVISTEPGFCAVTVIVSPDCADSVATPLSSTIDQATLLFVVFAGAIAAVSSIVFG